MKKSNVKTEKKQGGRFSLLMLLILCLGAFVLSFTTSCIDNGDEYIYPPDDSGAYELQFKYDSIRSYPGGGGIFVLQINPDELFNGEVIFSIEQDGMLNASLSKASLDKEHRVSEILINPDSNITVGEYYFTLKAKHGSQTKTKLLKVRIYDWACYPETAFEKLEQFKQYINNYFPKYNEIFYANKAVFLTYPEILIVEHFTFLTENYEVRMCFHVMIPPYNWSKLLIRNRSSLEAEIALTLNTDGLISEMPVSEYPVLCGY